MSSDQIKSTVIVALAALALVTGAFGQNGETPPYDPAPPRVGLSVYENQDLSMTLLYPKEFVPRTPEDLQTVMERGHRAVSDTSPKSDPEHLKALRCLRSLFYATPDPIGGKDSATAGPNFGDSILVEDFDRSCIPKKLKGDKALTALVRTALEQPGFIQLVQQMWFVAGGDRRIHSGMAGNMFTPPHCAGNKTAPSCSPVSVFAVAAAFEQREHDILIVYLSVGSDAKHELVPHMSVTFEQDQPILLFPFLLGKPNLIR